MKRKLLLPILAALGVVMALIMAIISLRKPPIPPIANPPPKPPYLHFVAGTGIIEANSLDIRIGTAISGLIEKLYVQPGDILKKGAPLFRVDTRELIAQEMQAKASYDVALANLNRLIAEPRPEDIPILEARVKQAQMRLSDEYSQYNLFQNVSDKRAISFNDFNQRKYAARIAKFELEQAKADLDLLKAGAWIEDIKIAKTQVEEATAQLEVVQTNLERAIVRAPIDGQVLQVNVNEGDFAGGAAEDTLVRDPLVIFGSIDPLHVRIDVDEDDAWRIFPGASATAFVRGNSAIHFPLEFVRIEPYVVPKRSLTGENLERVDTRVLQLVYRFQKKDIPIYIGQLLDIYIEAKPSEGL